MKKFTFTLFVIAALLGACAPQASATPEATLTLTPTLPPTETPVPTPTLHPQFAALQERISASGGRFTLNPDGTIFDGAEPLPSLTVAPDGTMTLTVDGETVTLDPTKAVFDDETGFSYPGYEQNEDGDWVEAVPSPEDVWVESATKWKLNLEDYTKVVSADGSTTTWVDKVTQKTVFVVGQGVATATGEKLQFSGHFELEFAKDMIANSGMCFKNEYVGAGPNLGPSGKVKHDSWLNTIQRPLWREAREKMNDLEFSGNEYPVHFLGGPNNCWATMPVKSIEEDTKTTPKSYLLAFDLDKDIFYVEVFDGDYVELPATD